MKKLILAIFIAIIATASVLYAQSIQKEEELPLEIQEWERLAEKGDTAAMHKLLLFYDDNAPVYLDVEEDDEKAIHYLVKSALNDYPEAVLEMKRIDPENPLWQHKADSLQINFPDSPIIR